MSERLRARDRALLATETPKTPLHNATLEIFEIGSSGFDYEAAMQLISERIGFVPRYRQRIEPVPGSLANPVWVNDTDFDLSFHVRRSALPRPGSAEQLRDLTARIVSRPLDRSRPLWEIYFIEGLEHDRVAFLAKSHQLLVDGIETVDLGQVLLDVSEVPKRLDRDDWHPGVPVSNTSLVLGAVQDSIKNPTTVATTLQSNAEALLRKIGGVAQVADGVFGSLTGSNGADSLFGAVLSQQRRVALVATDLADYRTIRKAHGGEIHDVILATVAGALRSWLMSRTHSFGKSTKVKALVPMSVIDNELEATSLGTQIIGHYVELPIAEPNPLLRLHQVAYSITNDRDARHAVGAHRLAGIAGFAPTTFHALGSRLAVAEARRGFDLAITNVPGPQFPLYAAGARMLETYPLGALLPGRALSVGITSYDGKVYFGITADRDAVADVDLLGQCFTEALAELLEATQPENKTRAPRGWRRPHQT
jgi:diacylglycerol O-acyltransferase / wax synthase